MTTDEPENPEADGSDDAPPESLREQRTDLAYQRSREAAERTLMAAARTAVSMISFGFTIAKLFESLGKLGTHTASGADVDRAPHHLGLVLLIGGTLTIGFGLLEYVGYERRLRRLSGDKFRMSTALFSASFVLAAGLFLGVSLVMTLF